MHIPWGDRIGTADFGPEALIDTDAILLRWFDQWLKDSGTFEGEPQVCHFVLGENRWREAETFPTEAEYTLYLHSEGKANSRKGNGTLSTASPGRANLATSLCTILKCPSSRPAGRPPQAAHSIKPCWKWETTCWFIRRSRSKNRCGFSAFRALFFIALLRARLRTSPQSLCASSPNGAAEFICIGVARSSRLFAKGSYAADKVHRWDFSLEPTSCRFARGDRIRLEIASSAFPLYRPESRERRAPLPGDFVGLAAIDAICVPRTRLSCPLCICPRPRRRNERRREVPGIEIAGVSKRYGNAHAVLESIDLVVGKQEFISLIGPSGCGKSTILKLIAGLSVPTSGAIRVDGMTPQNARETISFVFQDATLLPWRTVKQNVGLGLELRARGETTGGKKRLPHLLELVGLKHVAKSYPRELSGGMRMRVSIARALATNPRLMLLDEPFAALDEMSRDRLNEEILRLRAEQNWTAVFVTHSVAEAVFLSDRIMVLAPNPGRIHAEFRVDFRRQRTSAIRNSEEFNAIVARVSQTLRETLRQ